MTETETDLDHINRVILGDREAFSVLVRKYQPGIESFCTRMVRDAEAGRDLAQEAFIKAFQSLQRFRMNSSFKTWLYQIARNGCIDYLRNRARLPLQSLDELLENQIVLPGNRTDHDRLEASDLIDKILDRLPVLYREIVILRQVHELSYEEISQMLDCTVDAVKARLKRARLEIVKILRHIQ